MEASIEYQLGINYIYSEEVSAGEERLNDLLTVEICWYIQMQCYIYMIVIFFILYYHPCDCSYFFYNIIITIIIIHLL